MDSIFSQRILSQRIHFNKIMQNVIKNENTNNQNHIFRKLTVKEKLFIFPDMYGNIFMLYLGVKDLPNDIIEIILINFIESYLIENIDIYDLTKIFIIYLLIALSDNLDYETLKINNNLLYFKNLDKYKNLSDINDIENDIELFDIEFIKLIVSDLGFIMLERVMKCFYEKNIISNIFKYSKLYVFDIVFVEYIFDIHYLIVNKYGLDYDIKKMYNCRNSFVSLVNDIIDAENIKLFIVDVDNPLYD